MTDEVPQTELTYVRRAYDHVFEWYKVADSKAQLLLTLDGAFVTILTGTVFAKPEEAAAFVRVLGEASLLLMLEALLISGSILCGLLCLYSRLSHSRLSHIQSDLQVEPLLPRTFKPQIAWWFGIIASVAQAAHDSGSLLSQYLKDIDPETERVIMSNEIVQLSRNVLYKHRWVDRGWILASLALINLTVIGSLYLALLA